MNKGMYQKKNSKYEIESLNVSMEVKEMLEKIKSVAASGNPKIKASVKDLFIQSPSCKELSKIARCYEGIITGNNVYTQRGARTYLELAFPTSEEPRDYKEFFASPSLVSATQDRVAGVFLISFEQWKGAADVLRSPYFSELCKFITDNKENMSFVFHVKPDFKDSEKLYNELCKLVNLVSLEHSQPDLVQACEYVETQLMESGIRVQKNARGELKRLIEEKIDVTSQNYQGYLTLEQFVANLQFELYIRVSRKKNKETSQYHMVEKEDIRGVWDIVNVPNHSCENQRRLGFN